MKKSKGIKAIEKTALQHGVSTAEARAEMQNALDLAFDKNPADPFWSKWQGRKPPLEEFIVALSNKVLSRFGM